MTGVQTCALRSASGTSSTACNPGPAAGNGCYVQLNGNGFATFKVNVANTAGKSISYHLVGPAWSSAPLGGIGKITFVGDGSTPVVTSTPTPAATPTPIASTGTLQLLWSDEFTGAAGSSPSSSKWFTTIGDGCAAPDGICGWGNGERQWYDSNSNRLDGSTDGNLIITATRSTDTQNCYYGRCDWKSGKLTTNGKVSFTYGYLETRLKIPAGAGAWPAFWMLGTDIYTNPWPRSVEIDIMENLLSDPYTNWGTAHFADAGGGRIMAPGGNTVNLGVRLADAYHTYGILWKPGSITWFIDGISRYTLYASDYPTSQWPFGKTATDTPKFYAILNVAMGGIGGEIPASLNSTAMTVDYVRYYKANGQGTLNTP